MVAQSPKRRPTSAEFLPYGDSLKGVELVEQVLATRDDTHLSARDARYCVPSLNYT